MTVLHSVLSNTDIAKSMYFLQQPHYIRLTAQFLYNTLTIRNCSVLCAERCLHSSPGSAIAKGTMKTTEHVKNTNESHF